MSEPSDNQNWFLEGFAEDTKVARRVRIESLPFKIGRQAGLSLTLRMANISRIHAEIDLQDGALIVRDLGSRNGTFINHQRISGTATITPGDILHFGTCEFRVDCDEPQRAKDHLSDTLSYEGSLPNRLERGSHEFMSLLSGRLVYPVFQAILSVAGRHVIGYEVLGRGALDNFFTMPMDLFRVAATVGKEDELSRIFRVAGVEQGSELQGNPRLFINTHPAEMRDTAGLIRVLGHLREEHPDTPLTMEVHESLVTDPAAMRDLHGQIRSLGITLAYDDFGAGQARLVELAEAPPDYLKFDITMVHNIHEAPPQRQQMVEMLVKFAFEMGVLTVAEGVETQEEAKVCESIGFDCVQGFYFAKPVPANELGSDAVTNW